jgi:PhzF family phenazine biosynthesis protein
MEINIYQVDAFTDKTFGGNPAGVVPDGNSLSESDMQNIAKEMNLSETAFVTPIDKDNFKVRFFTTVCEVDLCGHATIGSFFTLAKKGYISSIDNGSKKIYQETKAGKLSVEIFYKDGEVDKVMMEQSQPKSFGKIEDLGELLLSMGVAKEDIGIGETFVYPEIISTGLPDIMLPLKKKETLDNLPVDFEKLAKVSDKFGVTGVHAFYIPSSDSKEVFTRNFAPLVGINEEAATGTSNGALIYFLKKNGYLDGNEIVSRQGASLNRPSSIHCMIEEKGDNYIVKVGGKAKIVIEGIISF